MVMLGMDTTTLCIMVMRKFNMRTRNSNPNSHLISMVIQLQGVFSVGKTLESVLVSTEFSPPVHIPLWFFTCTDRRCSHTFPWGFGYTYPHICLLQYGSASKPVFFPFNAKGLLLVSSPITPVKAWKSVEQMQKFHCTQDQISYLSVLSMTWICV